MNALSLISNQNAQLLASKQSALDVTAPVVDTFRPEAAAIAQGPDMSMKGKAGNAAFHLVFVGAALVGSIVLLGSLTGELEVIKAPGAVV